MTVNPSVTCCPDQAVEVADLYGCVSRILANSTGISSSISEPKFIGAMWWVSLSSAASASHA